MSVDVEYNDIGQMVVKKSSKKGSDDILDSIALALMHVLDQERYDIVEGMGNLFGVGSENKNKKEVSIWERLIRLR